jgi:hypothetical protein
MNTTEEFVGIQGSKAYQEAQKNRFQICQDWRKYNLDSEEAVWDQLREILDKWDWYGRAQDLAQQEMWYHWRRNEEFRRLKATPARWLTDWTSEMVRSAEHDWTEECWSLDCWIFWNDQWGRYCFTFDNEDPLDDVIRVIDGLAKEKGITRHFSAQFQESEDGYCWTFPDLEHLRQYPCLVLCPNAPEGLFADDEEEYIGGEIHESWDDFGQWSYTQDPRRYVEKDGWLKYFPGPSHPITNMFREKWKEFQQRRTRDLDQYADEPFNRANCCKMDAQEYGVIRHGLEYRARDILISWTEKQMKTSDLSLMEGLEHRLTKLIDEERHRNSAEENSQIAFERVKAYSRRVQYDRLKRCLLLTVQDAWGRAVTLKEQEKRIADLNGGTDYGGGHGPPWKGRATPLVPAGDAGARGSDWLNSDCSHSEPSLSSPNCFHMRVVHLMFRVCPRLT